MSLCGALSVRRSRRRLSQKQASRHQGKWTLRRCRRVRTILWERVLCQKCTPACRTECRRNAVRKMENEAGFLVALSVYAMCDLHGENVQAVLSCFLKCSATTQTYVVRETFDGVCVWPPHARTNSLLRA